MSYQKIFQLSALSTKNNSCAILSGTCLQISFAKITQLHATAALCSDHAPPHHALCALSIIQTFKRAPSLPPMTLPLTLSFTHHRHILRAVNNEPISIRILEDTAFPALKKKKCPKFPEHRRFPSSSRSPIIVLRRRQSDNLFRRSPVKAWATTL
jgi:hypothetical protein